MPYPGDDDIVYNTGYDLECADILATFRSRDWRSISTEEVLLHKDSLSFFSPGGLHYYMPAYLLACANHRRELDVAPDNLAFELTPPEQEAESRWDRFWTRARLFDRNQCRVLVEYLELSAEVKRSAGAAMGIVLPSLADFERAIAWWKARIGGA